MISLIKGEVMNNLWKGIAIVGIWSGVAVSAVYSAELVFLVAFCGMIATGVIACVRG